MSSEFPGGADQRSRPLFQRMLDGVEWAGNRLPDPVALFVLALLMTWGMSWSLSEVQFTEIDPRTMAPDALGQPQVPKPIRIINQLSGPSLTSFLTRMVKTFIEFPPLGVVLVALLGVGVAEHTGLVKAVIRALLAVTPARLLTPMLLFVAILSHSAGDTGYVLVIPLGGIIFATAGRHPIVGVVAAFAGVAGGFSASVLPSSLDPLLQGFTQSAAQILDPTRNVNPLCNYYFTSASAILIISVGWFITDCIVEPRLLGIPLDGDSANQPKLESLSRREVIALLGSLIVLASCIGVLIAAAMPVESSLRNKKHELFEHDSPLMQAIIPLIFVLFLFPGTAYGYLAGTIRSHRDIVAGMTKSMSTMSYYLVLAFFAAQFTSAFKESNVGVLIAVKGAATLQSLNLPPQVTIVGIILISAFLDLIVGSASAKWALLGPIFVPMLMKVGIAPELTQAAYRVGDSCVNIITPLMPYFPLVVLYCQQYVKKSGIGTLISLMLPYSMTFMVTWIGLLLTFWSLGLPLGIGGAYSVPIVP